MQLLNYLLAGGFLVIGTSLYFAKRKANRLDRELREEKYEREVENTEDYLTEAKRKLREAEEARKALEAIYRNPTKPGDGR